MQSRPPRLAQKLLTLFLREDLAEEVSGDLEESFYKEKSLRRAQLKYWYQVFNYIRPFALRKKHFHPLTQMDMLKNYFTVGWRNLLKHKMYSAINIGGFALGIAACALLALYIKGELSYDKHYVSGDRIFRIVGHSSWNGQEYPGLHFSHPFGSVIKDALPEIEEVGYYNAVLNFGAGSNEIRRTDRAENTHEEKIVYANQGLLNVLEVEFTNGNPSKALNDPKTVVITESTATKYFRNEDPVGKSIILNDDVNKVYAITGVIKDFPSTSHFNYDFLLTLAGDPFWKGESTSWCCGNYINYVRLKPGTDQSAFQKKIAPIVKTHILADLRNRNADADETKWANSLRYTLQPVDAIYLNQEDLRDDLSHGDIRFIWLFGSIAMFILILACINFINLSTARSASRAKEVGIRKSIGSVRSALVGQFLSESIMFSFIAIVFGVVITSLAIPAFNNLTGRALVIPWGEMWLAPTLVASSVLIGILAGLYPSFYLSSFRPAKVLKGNAGLNKKTTLRSVLVIFQFTISIVLIIGTVVIDRQMTYALNKDLGFDKEQLMVLHGTVTLGDKATAFKNELMKLSQVKSVSASNYLPVNDGKRDGGSTNFEDPSLPQDLHSQQWEVDTDYVRTMGFRIVRGRDFDSRLASDSSAMIINESMAKQFGTIDPIGARVKNYRGTFSIVGIVEDFHFHTLAQQISPVTMFVTNSRSNIISVKLQPGDPTSAIEAVTQTWKTFSANQPIRFEFLDDRFTRTYDDVKRFGLIVTIFASLAIIVACLGLFALSAFMIEQRGKEISIRVVLGAPVSHILRLLSQNFVVLVGVAFMIATPIAWMMMNKWLEDYAYKIDITWDVFAVTGITAIVIALATVGYQSVKASMTNPVAKLKSE